MSRPSGSENIRVRQNISTDVSIPPQSSLNIVIKSISIPRSKIFGNQFIDCRICYRAKPFIFILNFYLYLIYFKDTNVISKIFIRKLCKEAVLYHLF